MGTGEGEPGDLRTGLKHLLADVFAIGPLAFYHTAAVIHLAINAVEIIEKYHGGRR